MCIFVAARGWGLSCDCVIRYDAKIVKNGRWSPFMEVNAQEFVAAR